jgi:hypothetical protein
MLISVLGFGSIWTRRAAEADQSRTLDAAYYNTTGVHVAGTLRNRPRVYGRARFNGNSGFRPDRAFEALGRVFECEAPCIWERSPKVLFKMRLHRPAKPDAYLVTITADQSGGINKDSSADWLHPHAKLISFSECRDQQEVMLILPPFAWIRGGLGTFFLEPDAQKPWKARLVLSAKM